ncbi:dTDP-L-rhamnose 4-epimerase [Actinokineospora baliensis]|uniref:NAD-dependent epimerase/dehydratase family protein n=1 Tax=Actinokineospora baliensis TaxID=547056 RepID=UPI001959B41F|nr:NAD-dependent epimerase/dehydratase family protein [Actinokineospora baliensis]MBM7774284.1 dTDP-L-rhamnose 4-epimerase [Actinokineospora baliensis]
MRILLTGGAGFIGSHIADAVRAAGHSVVLLDCLLPQAHARGEMPAWLDGFEVVPGDVRDRSALDKVLGGVDVVCHQAAMVGHGVDPSDAPDYASINDFGTAVLLAAMYEHGIGRLVLASSMVVYGEGRYHCGRHGVVTPGRRRVEDIDAGRFEPGCPVCGDPLESGLVPEDAPLDPRSTYAATKLAQEHLCGAWARQTGGDVWALRYHNVYGPRMPKDTPYAGVASIFRSSLERGEAPKVMEDGGQRRDFVHVGDVAAANLAALTTPAPAGECRPVNICSGTPHTVGEMAHALAEAMGGPVPEVVGGARAGDVRHVVADPARARDELGFTAQVPFADGMVEFAKAPLRG